MRARHAARVTRRRVAAFAVAASALSAATIVATLAGAAPATAAPTSSAGGGFIAAQGRVLDTRAASHVGPYTTPMPANSWRSVPVTGHAEIPADASAVTVTLTVVDPGEPGVVHAAAAGAPHNISTSYLTYVAHTTRSNTAVVGVGAGGAIAVDATSATNLVIDVQGYYTAGNASAGGYVPIVGNRLVDTRSGVGAPKRVVSSGTSITVSVAGSGAQAVAPVGASAVMVNFTVLDRSTTGGYLTPYAAGTVPPKTSVNFPGTTAPIAIGAQVALARTGSAAGSFTVTVHGTSVNLLVDVVGYFTPAPSTGLFTAGTQRVYDSRTSGEVPIGPGSMLSIAVAGVGVVPGVDHGLQAVTTNVAAITPAGRSGYLRVWADGKSEPTSTSALDFTGGVAATMVTTGVGRDGAVDIRNISGVPVDVVVDVEGWYLTPGATVSSSTLRGLDMHDGTVVEDGGTYYLYGTQYGCGFNWGTANTPFCGFAVRSAPSLAGPWSAATLLFAPTATVQSDSWAGDNGRTWNSVCGATGRGCFNPRMLHRPDGAWVLWFNAPSDYFSSKQNAYWTMGCNGPTGPCGSAAGAPFGTDHKPALVPCADDGDFTILTSGTSASIVCSQGSLSEESLTQYWNNGNGSGVHNIPLAGVVSAEGVGGFQTADGTWEITYSDPQCGYCSGPPDYGTSGGATQVQAGYATATGMNGPWTSQGLLSPDYCTGQPRTVFVADDQPWEWIDQWTGARNETNAPIKLESLNSSPWSCT